MKSFKAQFADKVIESLEQEMPASENRVEPLYLEVVFRLQLVYQRFQRHIEEKILIMIQGDNSLLQNIENLKMEVAD